MGPNARVWRVYRDEAEEYDAEMVDGFRDTTDVLLVFAGLFSAVVSSFVSQSVQALQPDYAQITASLMTELVSIQRAVATGASISEIPISQLSFISDDTTTRFDRWVNALWFTSLTLSLIASLIAVLAKQWLLYYMSALSGSPRERVLLRHFRFMGLDKWKVSTIIGLLPVLLHVALFMFLGGLVVFTWNQNRMIAATILSLSLLAYSFYLVSNVLAAFLPDCSYKSPLSELIHYLWELRKYLAALCICFTEQDTEYEKQFRLIWFSLWLGYGPVKITSAKAAEYKAAKLEVDEVLLKGLLWLKSASSNPDDKRIVTLSFAGLPFGYPTHDIPYSREQELLEPYNLNITVFPYTERISRFLSLSLSRWSYTMSNLDDSLIPTSPIVQAGNALAIYWSELPTTLLELVSSNASLPPSIWRCLFNRRNGYNYKSYMAVLSKLFPLLFDILKQSRWDISGTSGTNWHLPPTVRLDTLCKEEPRMTHIIVSFLCSSLELPVTVDEPFNISSLFRVISSYLCILCDNVLLESAETIQVRLMLVEKVLLSTRFQDWHTVDFISALHLCVEVQNIVQPPGSLAICVPLYRRVACPKTASLVMLYAIDGIEHPWRLADSYRDTLSLLSHLLEHGDQDALDVFLKHGLSVVQCQYPIAFESSDFRLYSIIRPYILKLSRIDDEEYRNKQLYSILQQPNSLAWILWLGMYRNGSLDWIRTLYSVSPVPSHWKPAVDILGEEARKAFALHRNDMYWSIDRTMAVLRNVLDIINLAEETTIYGYGSLACPHSSRDGESVATAYYERHRVRPEGESPDDPIYGPFPIMYILRSRPKAAPLPVKPSVTDKLRKLIGQGKVIATDAERGAEKS